MTDPLPRMLLFTQDLVAGGGERQIVHLAAGLAELGHPVTLCCIGAVVDLPEELDDARVRLVSLHADTRAQRARAVPRMAAIARRADVVICSGWDESLWGRLAAILARRPAVAIEHAFDRSLQTSLDGRSRGSWIAWHNRLLDPFTYATVACAGAQIPLLRSEGVSERRLVLIPNGVPVERLRAASRTGATRAVLGIPPDARVIVHVARLTRLKNQPLALETARALRADLGDVHVVFAGDGEDRAALDALVEGLPWAHVLGAREDVPALLSLADLAVLPSMAEAMPMVIPEAFAVGTPVVANDVGDVGAILRRTGAGIAVAPGDDAAFVDACRSVLSDPRERARLSAKARDAAADFDADTMARRYGALASGAVARAAPAELRLDAA